MRRLAAMGALLLALPSLALAHVSVRPRESKPGVEERYTVRVPTEGTVATTHVILEVPASVMVLEVLPPDGATFETSKQGDRITAITWKKEIPPKGVSEFVFRARNPTSGDIVWKAHQHFRMAPRLIGSRAQARSVLHPSRHFRLPGVLVRHRPRAPMPQPSRHG